jgi:hypothetical protein
MSALAGCLASICHQPACSVIRGMDAEPAHVYVVGRTTSELGRPVRDCWHARPVRDAHRLQHWQLEPRLQQVELAYKFSALSRPACGRVRRKARRSRRNWARRRCQVAERLACSAGTTNFCEFSTPIFCLRCTLSKGRSHCLRSSHGFQTVEDLRVAGR